VSYHRFKLAQTVTSLSPENPAAPLVIVRLLPLTEGEPRYRVMSTIDGLQRAVPESQIAPIPQFASGVRSADLLPSRHADDENTHQTNHPSR
jgi:hypothetical protein